MMNIKWIDRRAKKTENNNGKKKEDKALGINDQTGSKHH